MGELVGLWNRRSPATRATALVVAGLLLGWGADTYGTEKRNAERSDRAAAVAAQIMHFSVAVECDKKGAAVLTAQEGEVVLLSCLNANGSLGEVDRISRIVLSDGSSMPDYNRVVDIAAPLGSDANDVDVDFVGPEGKVVMKHVSYDGNVINSGSARNTNAVESVVRVGN